MEFSNYDSKADEVKTCEHVGQRLSEICNDELELFGPSVITNNGYSKRRPRPKRIKQASNSLRTD